MPVLDFYVDVDEQQRKQRRAKWLIPLVAGLGAAMVLGGEKPPAPPAPKPVVVVPPPRIVAPPSVVEPPAPARIAIAPLRLDFDDSPSTRTIPAQIATIRNEGGQPLARPSAVVDGPFLATSGCVDELAPGDACMIAVVFAPKEPGRFAGSLKIRAGEERVQVVLRGSVPRPPEVVPPPAPAPVPLPLPPARTLCFDPPLLRFRATGTQTITLMNPEAAPVRVVDILPIGRLGQAISGYEIESRNCLRELKRGQQCKFTVRANELALQRSETIMLTVYYDDRVTGGRRAATVRSACH